MIQANDNVGGNGAGMGSRTPVRTDELTAIDLALTVDDRDVVEALLLRPEGIERERFACDALRIGVLAMRSASSQVDVGKIEEAGDRLISELRGHLDVRGRELTTQMASILQQYFGSEDGLLERRMRSLLRQDGELERVLRREVGGHESTLARTLADHLGKESPIFKMLSPEESQGLFSQIKGLLEAALGEQRRAIVGEFTLDRPDSALSRLVEEVRGQQRRLRGDMHEQLEALSKQFSLDEENSALSRLVKRVETVQADIANQFSADNESSALNRMAGMLQHTRDKINEHLTLDNEGSSLSRLKRGLDEHIKEIAKGQQAFCTEVRETLARIEGRDESGEAPTRRGLTFEDQIGGLLATEAQNLGDIYEATGSTVGQIARCKVGDHVVTLGEESAAAGARITWEAKDRQGYSVKQAIDEIDKARKNRQAQIGIFVYSATTAPEGVAPFKRYGNHLIIVWNPEDPNTDLRVHAAYGVARALATRETRDDQRTVASLKNIDASIRVIERQMEDVDSIIKMARTVRNNGDKILAKADRMRDALREEVGHLDEEVRAMRNSSE